MNENDNASKRKLYVCLRRRVLRDQKAAALEANAVVCLIANLLTWEWTERMARLVTWRRRRNLAAVLLDDFIYEHFGLSITDGMNSRQSVTGPGASDDRRFVRVLEAEII